jgi:hypothetical protein
MRAPRRAAPRRAPLVVHLLLPTRISEIPRAIIGVARKSATVFGIGPLMTREGVEGVEGRQRRGIPAFARLQSPVQPAANESGGEMLEKERDGAGVSEREKWREREK